MEHRSEGVTGLLSPFYRKSRISDGGFAAGSSGGVTSPAVVSREWLRGVAAMAGRPSPIAALDTTFGGDGSPRHADAGTDSPHTVFKQRFQSPRWAIPGFTLCGGVMWHPLRLACPV